VAALERAGFQIANPGGENPHYKVTYSAGRPPAEAFSKKYDDAFNPHDGFGAASEPSPSCRPARSHLCASPRARCLAPFPTPCHRKTTMTAKTAEACCPPAKNEPDLRPIEGPEADEELSALAKALGHPARVQILRLLTRRSSCVCGDIVDELPLAQSTVSQHLKVLKEAGLIRGDVDGPRVCYCIEPRTLRRFRALICSL
jgi:ArsR family transcriptional regulator